MSIQPDPVTEDALHGSTALGGGAGQVPGPAVRQRRRGDLLEAAILSAAWDELVEHGWSDFNMPRVAARAGTGKASVYSRWPTKAALVAATAHRHTQFGPYPLDLSHPLEETLRGLLRGAVHLLSGPFGSAVRALASDLPSIPVELREPFDSSVAVRVAVDVIDHARTTGELGPDPIDPHVVNVGFDVLTQRFLMAAEPPGPDVVARIVADIWLPALRAAAPPERS